MDKLTRISLWIKSIGKFFYVKMNFKLTIKRFLKMQTNQSTQSTQSTQSIKINKDYLNNHPEITPFMRYVLAEWMLEVSRANSIYLNCFYPAINILDKYMSLSKNIPKVKLQCIGSASLIIAYEIRNESSDRSFFRYMTDNAYTEEEINLCVYKILNTINFEVFDDTIEKHINIIGTTSESLKKLLNYCSLFYELIEFDHKTIYDVCDCIVSLSEGKSFADLKPLPTTTDMMFFNTLLGCRKYVKQSVQPKLLPKFLNICLDKLKPYKLEIKDNQDTSPVTVSRVLFPEVKERTFPVCKKLKKLGEGTYGVVYEVEDPNNPSKFCALKRLKNIDELEDVVVKELTSLRFLKHPNIVDIRDIWIDTDKKEAFILMEKATCDLYEYASNPSKYPDIKLSNKEISFQIIKGVQYLHSHNFIHRDLKPQNILVTKDGIKLTDFSLVKKLNDQKEILSPFAATLWYRPPEILLGCRKYGFGVDTWGVGCIIAQLFSKKPLFPGDSEIDQIFKIFKILGTPNTEMGNYLTLLPNFKQTFPNWGKNEKELKFLKDEDEGLFDLVIKLLHYNPSERLTLKDALLHPYFNFCNEELVNAVVSNDIEEVKNILGSGRKVNVNFCDCEPLVYACLKKNIEIAKLLVQSGAKINATHLHVTIESQSFSLVKYLIKNSSKEIINEEAVSKAIKCSRPFILMYLIKNGCKLNQVYDHIINTKNTRLACFVLKFGGTANDGIKYALKYCNPKLIKFYLKKGADIFAVSKEIVSMNSIKICTKCNEITNLPNLAGLETILECDSLCDRDLYTPSKLKHSGYTGISKPQKKLIDDKKLMGIKDELESE